MQHGRPERLPTISIHALRKESDIRLIAPETTHDISIHALRKESDRTIIHDADNFPGFQSTLSVRRVTRGKNTSAKSNRFQSTLSVRRVTSPRSSRASLNSFQSTLSVKRVTVSSGANVKAIQFQSTLSVRRVTDRLDYRRTKILISIHALRKESDHAETVEMTTNIISIHALRKESDCRVLGLHRDAFDFNPRSP